MQHLHAAPLGNLGREPVLISQHGTVHHQRCAVAGVDRLPGKRRGGCAAIGGALRPVLQVVGEEAVLEEVVFLSYVEDGFAIDAAKPFTCDLKAGVETFARLSVEHLSDTIEVGQIGTELLKLSEQFGDESLQIADSHFQSIVRIGLHTVVHILIRCVRAYGDNLHQSLPLGVCLVVDTDKGVFFGDKRCGSAVLH